MFRTFRHKLTVLLGTLAIAAFAIGCGAVESGTVVEVTEDSVTVADDTAFAHSTYRISPDASILRDGQPAALDDIEQGDAVSVTVTEDTAGNEIATVISADSNGAGEVTVAEEDAPRYEPPPDVPPPAARLDGSEPDAVLPSMRAYQGDVVAVGDDMLMLSDPAGTQLAFIVNDETQITINGQPAELESIGAGFVAIVTAREDVDELVAVEIEATAPASARESADDQNTEPPGSESGAGEYPELPEGPQL